MQVMSQGFLTARFKNPTDAVIASPAITMIITMRLALPLRLNSPVSNIAEAIAANAIGNSGQVMRLCPSAMNLALSKALLVCG